MTRGDATRGDAGFTLVELLVSMSIMLAVTGVVFGLVHPGESAFRVQPEVADIQQRLRVATSLLHRDLMMAGAGTYTTGSAGPLSRFVPPVLPYRVGRTGADPDNGVFFRDDAISVRYVPNTAAQTTILDTLATPSATIRVNTQPGCPAAHEACGFVADDTVIVFDDTGAGDTFRVAAARGNRVQLRLQGTALSTSYPPGSTISRVVARTYHLDAASAQLMQYDGWSADVPLVDDVVGLGFRYLGDPSPPTSPKPPPGSVNCLFDSSGHTRLPTLKAHTGSLVELPEPLLTDGPWCGTTNRFDADLYRIRTVVVDLRMQAGSEAVRGSDRTLFRRPGDAVLGTRMVPDQQIRFDVSPRNMNLAR